MFKNFMCVNTIKSFILNLWKEFVALWFSKFNGNAGYLEQFGFVSMHNSCHAFSRDIPA